MLISAIEKLALTTAGSPLSIRCKNFQNVTLIIPRDRDCHDIYTSLLKLSRPAQIEELYAFLYTASNEGLSQASGWQVYDMKSEYERQGVPNKHWHLTSLNQDYEICDTYPRYFFSPASASTVTLVGSSKFRSRGRLPVLSYYYSDNQSAICRCSQPLSGFSARCVEDEDMLESVMNSNPNSSFLYVVDTRPKINAVVNRAQGKGYENENFYSNIKFVFQGIENIHVMRSSQQRLLEACELKDNMNSFLSNLESSGWFKHIKSILDTAKFIVDALTLEGISVVVHCSDGWDRTAQTISLASLLMDPFYRTCKGFQVLIEKEWLSFGHKFTDRCGHIEIDVKETAPIFTQFLDSVYQVSQQYPSAFQFNERFLITLHDHVYSCQFGTFIGNCEKDRKDLRLSERTYSLWAYLDQHLSEYINPLYERNEKEPVVLKISTSPQLIRFWRSLYMRYESGAQCRENIEEVLSSALDRTCSLEDHIRLLQRRVSSLRHLLKKPDLGKSKSMYDSGTSDSLSLTESDLKSPTLLGNGQTVANLSLFSSSTLPLSSTVSSSSSSSVTTVTPSLEQGNGSGGSDGESGISVSPSRAVGRDSGVGDGRGEEEGRREGEGREVEVRGEVEVREGGEGREAVEQEHLSGEQIRRELGTVAVNWQSLRTVRQCNCGTPLEVHHRKYYCWCCGCIECSRCIVHHTALPGHYSSRPVPVCKSCYKTLATKG